MTDSFVLFHKPPGFPFYFITGSLPKEVVTTLEEALSYSVKDVEFAQVALAEKHAKVNLEREKQGLPIVEYPPWDGKEHFLRTTKNGKKMYIPVGLAGKAIQILSFYEIGVTVKDEYDHQETKENFAWGGPKLRDYQTIAVLKAISSRNGVISLPTGSGKSMILMRIVYALGMRTLIVVHRKELFKQWCDNIESVFGLSAIWDAGSVRVYQGITVGMVQTLQLGTQQLSNVGVRVMESNYDIVAVDEAHHTPAKTFYNVAKKIDARYKIGMSATTEREDGAEMKMEAALGPVIVRMHAADLITDGFLSLPVFEFIEFDATSVTGKTFPQIYRSGIVSNQERNLAIAVRVRELVEEGRQVYIHVDQILHGQILSEMLKIPFVYSKSKDREETIETFKKGYTRAICSTLLGEGVDIPSISAIVMAGGKKTKAGTIQKIGRALRPDEKFKTAIVVDFADRGHFLSDHAMTRFNTYVEFYGEDIVLGRKKC